MKSPRRKLTGREQYDRAHKSINHAAERGLKVLDDPFATDPGDKDDIFILMLKATIARLEAKEIKDAHISMSYVKGDGDDFSIAVMIAGRTKGIVK